MGRTLLLGGVYAGRGMAVTPMEGAAVRQKWSLTQDAFDRLLSSLGPDRDAAGKRYLEIRRNLVRLFEWRGCYTPDEYADETINRCARKFGEGEEIRDVATYCTGIARMVLREMSRDRSRQARPLEEAPEPRAPQESGRDSESRVECLRQCLGQLSPDTRNLILHYYQGDKGDKIRNRKSLTERLGIPGNTLRMRALRVRERLQVCAATCMQRAAGGVM